jgi:glycosyltransferase involved in cell wall biosynthesis
VASSPVVADRLRRAGSPATVTLAPLSLDPVYYPPASPGSSHVAGIIGTASWPPTRDAMKRAVSRIWPLVRRQLPGAVLRVAGRGTTGLGLSGAGVEVVGEVGSASEFLRGLGVLLYPLSRGSGMKVKVLESLAVGLPVVTTTAGTEGVDGGEGVLVGTTDDELVELTVRLLGTVDARRSHGHAGRLAFQARYTPEIATEPLVRLYAEMRETRR